MMANNLGELITARLRARYGDHMPIAEAEAFSRELLAAVIKRMAATLAAAPPGEGRSLAELYDEALQKELTQ
jgi:hypothetical protein